MNQLNFFSKTASLFNRKNRGKLLLEALCSNFLLNDSISILDIGGGTGVVASAVKSSVKSVTVLDPSAGMIEQCKKRSGIMCILGGAEKMPFPDQSFDLVVMTDAFHHIPKQGEAIKEIFRVLRLSGKAVVEEYDPLTLRGRLVVWLEGILRLGSVFFAPDQLKLFWEKYGFTGRVIKNRDGSYVMQFEKQ